MTLDGIPFDALGQAAGWPLFAALAWLVIRAIVRGDLVTRREADAKDRRIDALEALTVTKDKTIADFTEAVETSNAITKALVEVAEERKR